METRELFLRIAPDRFHFLKFIVEGYDNLAILSSHDMARGIVRLRYIATANPEIFQLLAAIASQLNSGRQAGTPSLQTAR